MFYPNKLNILSRNNETIEENWVLLGSVGMRSSKTLKMTDGVADQD